MYAILPIELQLAHCGRHVTSNVRTKSPPRPAGGAGGPGAGALTIKGLIHGQAGMRFLTSFDVSTRAPTPEQPRIRFRMQDHARRLSGRPLRQQVDSPRVTGVKRFRLGSWDRDRTERRDAVYGRGIYMRRVYCGHRVLDLGYSIEVSFRDEVPVEAL